MFSIFDDPLETRSRFIVHKRLIINNCGALLLFGGQNETISVLSATGVTVVEGNV